IWLPMYLIGAGWSIDPGHSDFSPLRPLLHSHIAEHRIVQPILSTSAISEIGWELAVTGAALVLVAAWFVRGSAQRALLIGTVPVLVFVIWFWPVQGIGNDSDFLGSAFPAAYAAAWLIAGNAAMAHILTWGFVHSPIPQ
ncbi:MAG: hypothetical protein M3P18_23030, partial [Actinomycetota bacterium]|nr:hypothetical protein [Actinomycetota bacterium]